MGRPSLYTDQLADEICRRIAGGESLVSICGEDGMPDRATVTRWQGADPGFAAQCARARELQAEWHDAQMGKIESDVLRGDLDPQAARVVLSSKQWRMSKMAPKVYGDRIDVTTAGDKLPAAQSVDLTKLPPDVLRAILAACQT